MDIVGRNYMLITSGSSRVKWCWRGTERQSENWLPTTWCFIVVLWCIFTLFISCTFEQLKFLYQFTHNIAQTYHEDISSKNSSLWPPLFPSRFCTHPTRPQGLLGTSGKKNWSGHLRKWEPVELPLSIAFLSNPHY